MRTIIRNLIAGFIAVALCTFGLGIVYPAAAWGISRVTADRAEGHLVYDGECLVASQLLDDGRTAEGATAPERWFYGRSEGATNLGPSSPELAESIKERRATIAARENVSSDAIPADALTGSGSGVDADISIDYAKLQVPRVARAHNITEAEVLVLLDQATHKRPLKVLGEDSVNVTQLNLSLPGGQRC